MNNDIVISLQHLRKSFDGKLVLDDISLDIREGEFVTLLGPSGCGKTTTLRLIAGFMSPDEGRILLDGKDICELPPYRRPFNTVFQRYALFPHLDVYDNIAFGLKLQKLPTDEIDAKGRELDALQRMSDVANGRLTGARKVQFEQYIQAVYFDRVLQCANRRLSDMSGGRFELRRRAEDDNNRSQTALDIDVLDNFTGKVRSVKSLSGGESFKAALSLALGLSDSIQMMAGGSRVDALFIDEGFGSLDSDSLEQALDVLDSLTAGDVMIGVISHVDLLRERIDRRITVTREKGGSRVEASVD